MDRRRFLASAAALPLVDPLARLATIARGDHVVVVGAGAFGGWTALSLLRAGFRVTLVDAWGAGNSRSSSGDETRVIRAGYNGQAVYIRMVARAAALWKENEVRWGRRVFFPIGCLWMCPGDDAFVRTSMAPIRASGLAIEEWTVAEAQRRFPHMGFAGVRSVFFEPAMGYLLARESCELVRESFVREGGDYVVAAARAGRITGGRLGSVALASGQQLEADRFVIACGPWMSQFFPDAIGRRIVATRQEVFYFGSPAGATAYEPGSTPVWVHLGDHITYGIPGNERRGMKVADDTAGPEVDPTSMDRLPDAARLADARVVLRDRFPALANAPLVESRVCQYEESSDGHYLVDRHPELANVWLAGGGSGHGFKMGPAIGEHVTSLVMGTGAVEPLFAWSRLRPRP
ncbi:MAG TPA: FAD-dependent oxidoreductase [Gemmatimonadaceae bacterium]|nr:FAD-dependent oxidoreductase [Gemmatimonadaceae bacterium]